MLLEGLKCKQLEENKIYIIQRELQINNHKTDNGLNEAVIQDNSGKMSDSLYKAFLGTTETPVHFIFFLGSLSSRDYLFLFICYCKIAFCLGASTQYQHLTTSK